MMLCDNCGLQSSRIKVYPDGSEACHNCSVMSEAAGPKIDGILTRNSERIRTESVKREGDTITPFHFNRNTKKQEINPEFIKLYPDAAKDYFKPDELRKEGLGKLIDHSKNLVKAERAEKKRVAKELEFSGDHQQEVAKQKEVIGIK